MPAPLVPDGTRIPVNRVGSKKALRRRNRKKYILGVKPGPIMKPGPIVKMPVKIIGKRQDNKGVFKPGPKVRAPKNLTGLLTPGRLPSNKPKNKVSSVQKSTPVVQRSQATAPARRPGGRVARSNKVKVNPPGKNVQKPSQKPTEIKHYKPTKGVKNTTPASRIRNQIEKISTTYYGGFNEDKINDYMRKYKSNHISEEKLLRQIKAGAASTKLQKQAGTTIANQLNPRLAAEKKEIKDVKKSYGSLGQVLRRSVKAQKRENVRTVADVARTYANTKAGIESQYSGASTAANAEINRLGLGEAGPAATEGLVRDKAFLGGLTGGDAANAKAVLGSNSSLATGLLRALRGEARTERVRDVGDLRFQRKLDKSSRGGLVSEALSQLRLNRSEARAAGQQQNFLNRIAAGKFGLEEQQVGLERRKVQQAGKKLNADIWHTRTQDSIAWQKLKLDRWKSQNTDSEGNPKSGLRAAKAYLADTGLKRGTLAEYASTLDSLQRFEDYFRAADQLRKYFKSHKILLTSPEARVLSNALGIAYRRED